jgi:hypothetical protein
MQDLDPIDQIYQGNLIFSGLDMPERIKPIENNPPNTKANIFFILEYSNDMTNEINRNKSSKHESHSCNHGAFRKSAYSTNTMSAGTSRTHTRTETHK